MFTVYKGVLMKKIVCIITCCLLVCTLAFSALGVGGGIDDPLMTLSGLKAAFTDIIDAALGKKSEALSAEKAQKFDTSFNKYKTDANTTLGVDDLIKNAAIKAVRDKLNAGGLKNINGMVVPLANGEEIILGLGAEAVLLSGTANVSGTASDIVNATVGRSPQVTNAQMARNNTYVSCGAGTVGLKAGSDGVKFMITGSYSKGNAYTISYGKYAQALFDLSLFRGTGNGFELGKQATRVEAIVMLVRLLGEESAALAHANNSPFTDLNVWDDGKKYIAYAYERGYTTGVNTENTLFAPNATISPEQFYTMVLRALKYDDKVGDFHWKDSSAQKAQEVGIVNATQRAHLAKGLLYRDGIAVVSYNALSAKLKNSTGTLGQSLVVSGVLTQDSLNNAAQYILSH